MKGRKQRDTGAGSEDEGERERCDARSVDKEVISVALGGG